MKIIEIIVDPQGNVKLQTKGYSGNECRSASAEIEKSLGVSTAEQLTPEFYQVRAANQEHERQRP
jgi:hypothetical protein